MKAGIIDSQVFFTKKGTPYLKSPGLVLVAKPEVNLAGIKSFINGFPKEYEFASYLKDKGVISSALTVTVSPPSISTDTSSRRGDILTSFPWPCGVITLLPTLGIPFLKLR